MLLKIKTLLVVVLFNFIYKVDAQIVVDSMSSIYTSSDTAKVTFNIKTKCKKKNKSKLYLYFSIGALGDSVPTTFPVLTQTISPAPTSLNTGDLLTYLQNKPIWLTGNGRRIVTHINSSTTVSSDSLKKGYYIVKAVLVDGCCNTVTRMKKGVIPPGFVPSVSCLPCQFIPTYKTVYPGTYPNPLYYINDYQPLPTTYLGLPAVHIDEVPSQSSLNIRIRGIQNEYFPNTLMTWTGPTFGNTGLGSDILSTCNGGLVAKQGNDRLILNTDISAPTLITATFNIPNCGGVYTISFYVLPATPQSFAVPTTGVLCPITYPVNYNGNSYASESTLLSAVQANYPGFSITYNNTNCIYTFTGVGTPPSSINLSHLTGTPVPVIGRGCPIEYPAYWSSDLISDETDLINTVSFVYSLQGFNVTYESSTCTFYFDGSGTPPANITLYTPVSIISTPNNCGNLYNMDNPIIYNSNTYNSKTDFINAVQANYPSFTVTDGLDGTFHFLGTGTPPISIPASFTNYSVTNTDYGTLIINWNLTGTTITGNFVWTGVSGTINWVLQDIAVHSSGTTSPGVVTPFSTTITNPSGSNGLLQLVVTAGNQVATCIAYLP